MKNYKIIFLFFSLSVNMVFCQEISTLIEKSKLYPTELISTNKSQKFPICFDIDATKSIDFYNPSLIFRWSLEGEKKEGIKTEYCLNSHGNFKLILTVFDSITNTQIREKDTTFELIITPTNTFKIINRNGTLDLVDSIKFIYTNYDFYYSGNPEYETILWQINKEYFLGNITSYIFDKRGFYEAICYVFDKSNSTIKTVLRESFEIKYPK